MLDAAAVFLVNTNDILLFLYLSTLSPFKFLQLPHVSTVQYRSIGVSRLCVCLCLCGRMKRKMGFSYQKKETTTHVDMVRFSCFSLHVKVK